MNVLLGAHDVKRCARRIHNEWDPTLQTEPWEVPAALQLLFDQGNRFQDEVFAELLTACCEAIDLADGGPKQVIVGATLGAMDAGLPLILNGWLPDDLIGGRKGRPDLLIHVGDGRYIPGKVKNHLVTCTRKKGELTFSLPGAPGEPLTQTGRTTRDRIDDALQLAHYWRMLETLGRTPQHPTGIVIGTDRVLAWLDLERPAFTTFSRSSGTAKRSALQRYDHEHGFRHRVATAAAGREQALVLPIFVDECDSCPWYEYCRSITDADVASAHITKGRLSVREWQALSAAGITTVQEMATLDTSDEAFQQRYLPEVAHHKDALRRLSKAVRRARMVRDGLVLERVTAGPIEVPSADVEIDLDIEWDPAEQVYLWGCLMDGRYYAHVTFEEMTESVGLADDFAQWLRRHIAMAERQGKTALIYHYSPAETTWLRRLLGDASSDLLDHCVDLFPIVKRHFFGLQGLGIKQVAPAFGFRWHDEEPGGLQSQVWLQQARLGDRHSQERILRYNEDDVRATAAVRAGLRAST
jgi:hypothetical protein